MERPTSSRCRSGLKRFWPAKLAGAAMLHLCVTSGAAELSIQNTQSLSFGSFAAGGSAGSVTVDLSGARSSSGGVVLIPSSEGAAAEFTVAGDPHATYTVELPSDGFVELAGPGRAMVIDQFTSNPAGVSGQLSAGGTQTLSVGGTLNIESGQAAGEYTGSFTVVVNYQ